MNESTALVVTENDAPPRVISETDYRLATAQIKDCDDPVQCRRVAASYEAVATAFRKTKDDPTTVNYARRLQLWALRRCGELLAPWKAVQDPAFHSSSCTCRTCAGTEIRRAADFSSTQKSAAHYLGISVDTVKRMIFLAVIPYSQFEAAVERTPPPAFQSLASMAPRLRVVRTPPPPPTPPPAPTHKGVSRTKAATRERFEMMAKLAADGHSSEQIAEVVKISAAHVRLVLREAGVDLPADRALGGRQKIDSRRMVEAIVSHAETLTDNIALINFHDLAVEDCGAWLTRLRGAQHNLAGFIRQLTRITISKGGAVWESTKTEK